jgi:glycosyltransferase involved in cell wall biosynthesis
MYIYKIQVATKEGMPTSVLEAMAFGLPVISRPVGGIKDFFQNEKMGYLLESKDPAYYYEAIIKLLENKDLCKEIGLYNYSFAKENFMASIIAKNIETIARNA